MCIVFLSLFRYQQHSLALMEAYDPRRNVWLKLADMGSPCSGLGACALFGLLYTVGWTRVIVKTLQKHYSPTGTLVFMHNNSHHFTCLRL